MSKPTHAYIGRAWCGCVQGSVVDMDDDLKDTARMVSEMIKQGLKIERVPLETVKLDWDCQHVRGQLTLFDVMGKSKQVTNNAAPRRRRRHRAARGW